MCQCININIIPSCLARSLQSLFSVYLPSGKDPDHLLHHDIGCSGGQTLIEQFSSWERILVQHQWEDIQWCTPARTHSEYFNETQYQSMAHKHQSPERNSWNRSTIQILSFRPRWILIWMIFSQTTKLTLSILQNPFKTFKSLEIPLIH